MTHVIETTDLDLDAYARRIGLAARRLVPDFDTLAAIVESHGRSIPFENIDVLARRVPALDLPALHDKLVVRRRGGYCFEQNGLLLGVLRQIGFDARGREARVMLGVPPGTVTGRTHMVVQVTIAGVDWLADVGFGGSSPTAPIRLASREEQVAGTGRYRFAEDGPSDSGLVLRALASDGWFDCYRLLPSSPAPIDYQMGNWFVATWPQAFLGNNLLVSRTVDGGRLRLFNRTLATLRPETAAPELREIDSRPEMRELLADDFGLALAEADFEAVMAAVEKVPPA